MRLPKYNHKFPEMSKKLSYEAGSSSPSGALPVARLASPPSTGAASPPRRRRVEPPPSGSTQFKPSSNLFGEGSFQQLDRSRHKSTRSSA